MEYTVLGNAFFWGRVYFLGMEKCINFSYCPWLFCYACRLVITLKGIPNVEHLQLVCVWVTTQVWRGIVGSRRFLSWHCMVDGNWRLGIVQRMLAYNIQVSWAHTLYELLVQPKRPVDLPEEITMYGRHWRCLKGTRAKMLWAKTAKLKERHIIKCLYVV